MIDAAGDVIYVGKARSLKARVSSYVRMGGHTNRIARMISATAGHARNAWMRQTSGLSGSVPDGVDQQALSTRVERERA
jgi:hypothetical protein